MNEVKITVPDNLIEITLGQYQDYLKQIDGLDAESDRDKINNKAIEAFCWTNYDSMMSIPLKEYERVLEVLNRAFNAKQPFIQKFNMGDFKFGFIPKLDEMSLGEYIDLETYFNDWQEMHKAMAILYRPIAAEKKSKYGIIPYDPDSDRQDMMRDMPLSIVMGCMVFFYRLGTQLSRATLNYLHRLKKRKDISSQVKMALERNGDGISRFTHLLKETSEDLMRSRPFHYTSA